MWPPRKKENAEKRKKIEPVLSRPRFGAHAPTARLISRLCSALLSLTAPSFTCRFVSFATPGMAKPSPSPSPSVAVALSNNWLAASDGRLCSAHAGILPGALCWRGTAHMPSNQISFALRWSRRAAVIALWTRRLQLLRDDPLQPLLRPPPICCPGCGEATYTGHSVLRRITGRFCLP